MPYEHACFISYTRGEFPLMQSFVEQVSEALKSELEAYFGSNAVYIDEERLQPGYRYNEALASALCRSVCMVVVYTPWYEQSSYCLREYTGMRALESRRLTAPVDKKHGLIIPVVLRGKPELLPDEITGHIHYSDFSQFSTATRRILRNDRYLQSIIKVAAYIDETARSLIAAGVVPGDDCEGFTLPPDDDVIAWNSWRAPAQAGRVE